jgi:hypothetical protein
VTIPPGVQVGAYQVRIVGLDAAAAVAVVGSFGDALTLTVQP